MPDSLAALAQRISVLEQETSSRVDAMSPVPLQCPPIDGALPGDGLARGAIHELAGPAGPGDQRGDGALMGFGTVLLSRLMQADEAARPALWCMNRRLQHVGGLLSGHVYSPGLQAFGVPLDRLLFAYTGNDSETLWAMEEALRSGAVCGVIGELNEFAPVAARRLQLAAQGSGSTGLVLWPGRGLNAASFAETRWRLSALPSPGGKIVPHWRVSLLRARRSAVSRDWAVRWQDGRLYASPAGAAAAIEAGAETGAGSAVSPLAYRPLTA